MASQVVQAQVLSSIKFWLSDQKSRGNRIDKPAIDSLISGIDWKSGEEINIDRERSVLYFPLNNSSLGVEFFFSYSRSAVDSGNIVSINVSKSTVDVGAKEKKVYYDNIVASAGNAVFSGKITKYSIAGRFLYGRSYVNGKMISRTFVARIPEQQKVRINGLKAKMDEACELWGVYEYFSDGSSVLLYTFWICEVECVPPSLAVSIQSGQQFVKSNCIWNTSGGGGGNGVPVVYSVNNTITVPCIATVANLIANSNFPDTLSAMFRRSFIDPGSMYNYKFTDGFNISGPAESFASATNEWTTRVNPSVLQNSSKEYIASVMIHEIEHYYISHYFGQLGYPVYDNWMQHEYMFKNFVTASRDLLRNLFSGLSEYDATALALGGMEDVLHSDMPPASVNSFNSYFDRFARNNYNMGIGDAALVRTGYNPSAGNNPAKGTKACN